MDDVLAGLRAIAEPTRLRILVLCARSELSVTDLVDILGQSQPRVSRHLKLMVEAGVLERNREGARAYYRVAERTVGGDLAHALTPLVPVHDAMLETDLARLETIRIRRSERATAYFQENAVHWEDLRGLYVDDELVDASLMEAVRAEPVETLLDIGTGTGRVLEQLADHVTSAVGVDNAKPMLEIARDKLDRAGVSNCQVRFADMYHLPFPARPVRRGDPQHGPASCRDAGRGAARGRSGAEAGRSGDPGRLCTARSGGASRAAYPSLARFLRRGNRPDGEDRRPESGAGCEPDRRSADGLPVERPQGRQH